MSDTSPPTAATSAEQKRALLQKLLEQKARQSSVQVPLSDGQRALWLHYKFTPESSAYNILFTGRIRSCVDVAAFTSAILGLVQRHPALRTTFTMRQDEPVQVVHPRMEVSLAQSDLAGSTESERYETVRKDAQRPFDLEQGPTIRFHLYSCGTDDHILLIAVHHIVSDYWSLAVMVDELGKLYAAARTGLTPALPPLPADYSDFVRWQANHLSTTAGEQLRSYWQDALAGDLPVLQLTPNRPRPAVQTFAGGAVPFRLNSQLVEQLEAVSKAESVTPYVTLLTAFQVLLHRYTGQTEILIGSPTSGRNRLEFDGVVGYFANPIVLRTHLHDQATFRTLLRASRGTVLSGLAHQDYPFPRVVEQISAPRDASRSPIFQAMFAFQRAPRLEEQDFSLFMTGDPNTRLKLGDLVLHPYPMPQQEGQFDLTLTLTKAGTSLSAGLLYNSDLFQERTIAQMAEHFGVLVEAMVSDPDRLVSQYPLMPDAEVARITLEWNRRHVKQPQDRLVHTLVAQQASLTPDSIAIQCDTEQLTYRALDRQANQLAHCLRARGVGPEVPVGVFLDRTPLAVVALLGILKAGGAYVPLDPSYPEQRLAFMLKDSAAPLVLTTRKLAESLPQCEAQVVCLDTDWPLVEAEPDEEPAALATPTTLAYIIYTSGSTGNPKGVLMEHGALVSHCLDVRTLFELSARDCILQFSSFNFDTSLEQLLPGLTVGATVVLRGNEHWSAHDLQKRMESCGITVANLPTAYWHQLVQVWSETASSDPPRSLRLLIVGGEAMLAQHLRLWQQMPTSSIRLLNAYGPTETTITSHTFEVPRTYGADTLHAGVPIGWTIGSRTVYLLDPFGQPLPIGVPGELYIGGTCVARGYLNQPDLTTAKFVPDPFAADPLARLYRTGDLARFLPDGNLEFLGRIDNQVKVRGFRIELGEIEASLVRHPAIAGAAVIVREDSPGTKRLVAYVMLKHTNSPSSAELRSFLAENLPDYMVPNTFVQLEAIPLTPNGKVDRNALPAPVVHESSEQKVAPRSDAEVLLTQIWSQVLRVERVGIHDNFFDIGGDSILAIQVVARASQCGLPLTPKQVFEHQTIAQLAAAAGGAVPVKAQSGVVTGPVPLTPIQRWFFAQDLSEPHHFNQAVLLDLVAPVQSSALERALVALVEHHDSLRLRYHCEDGEWKQHNAGLDQPFSLQHVDLTHLPEADQHHAIEASATTYQTTLDLAHGPLLRAVHYDCGPSRSSRLLIIIHHLAVDGVSWRILIEDLNTAYQQVSQGLPLQLPPKTTSFQEWAQALVTYAQTDGVRADLNAWVQQMPSGASPQPRDFAQGENTVASAAELSLSLTADETIALLQEVPRAYRTQISDVLLTALVQSFRPWTGQPSLLIDLEGHGREALFDGVDLSRTTGWFTSVYPVWLKLFGTESPGDALKSVKDQLRQIPSRGITHGVLRYLCDDQQAVTRLASLPSPEVVFNYLGQFDQVVSDTSPFRLSSLSSGKVRSLQGSRSHLLNLDGSVVGGQLRFIWTYSLACHKTESIQALANAFMGALRSLTAHCLSAEAGGYTPSDFPLARLSPAELSQLVGDDRDIEDIYPLSPMQQGMLFHALLTPESDLYVAQLQCLLRGELDLPRFERAWRQVFARHPVLRSRFVWDGLREPLQIVSRRVPLPWVNLDWRTTTEDERAERLRTLAEADRMQGFPVSTAPLMRITVIRCTDDTYHFVWTHHHLLLDGWSLAVTLSDVLACYERLQQDLPNTSESKHLYKDYIHWLQKQYLDDAETFWVAYLHGLTTLTPIVPAVGTAVTGQEGWLELELTISPDQTRELQSRARQAQVTLNTLLQGAWALMLGYISGRDDVMFGGTVSGRPADLPGVESIVGLFINTLPVRVRIRPDMPVDLWLQQLQAEQMEGRRFEFSPLSQVQNWSQLPKGQPLFESILVFENYPRDPEIKTWAGLAVSHVRSIIRANYPLVVEVTPGPSLTFQMEYDASRFHQSTVHQWLRLYATLIDHMLSAASQSVGELRNDLSHFVEAERARQTENLSTVKASSLKKAERKAISLKG